MRSIVSKILIQINAKIGGIPWTVTNLPLMNEPSMIVAFDLYSNTGRN